MLCRKKEFKGRKMFLYMVLKSVNEHYLLKFIYLILFN